MTNETLVSVNFDKHIKRYGPDTQYQYPYTLNHK